jgi:hypothetical protein
MNLVRYWNYLNTSFWLFSLCSIYCCSTYYVNITNNCHIECSYKVLYILIVMQLLHFVSVKISAIIKDEEVFAH